MLETFTLLVASALLAGCSSTPEDKTAGWSTDRIYAEARDEMGSGGYDKAVPLFEKLEGRAAGTPLAQQAQLDKAYAQYKSGSKAQAIATLDRFMKLHPASPALDYALYLKGLINFNEDLGLLGQISQQDMTERDPKGARESFDSFRELVTRFPDSKYTPDAILRMKYLVNALVSLEVHVARYYMKRGAYLAAINRAQYAVKTYPDAPATEEALFIMVKAYDQLGMNDLRDDSERIMRKNFPNSVYYTRGLEREVPWWKLW